MHFIILKNFYDIYNNVYFQVHLMYIILIKISPDLNNAGIIMLFHKWGNCDSKHLWSD